MARTNSIEWTDATWNPVTGCTLVSDGCRNCYAARLAATRLKNHPSRAGLARLNAKGEAKFTGEVRFNEQWLDQPLRWRKPRMIFVCAHGDLFHESVPDDWIDKVFAVMALSPQHTFQVLTKRSDRMRAYFEAEPWDRLNEHCGMMEHWDRMPQYDSTILPHVWLGVSVEDQQRADERIPDLLATPAAIRFASYEPALGPVDWTAIKVDDELWDVLSSVDGPVLDWIIAGGESVRPCHPDWIRQTRDQCAAAGTAFHFKQWGAWRPAERMIYGKRVIMGGNGHVRSHGSESFYDDDYIMVRVGKKAAGRLLDGVTHDAFPARRPAC